MESPTSRDPIFPAALPLLDDAAMRDALEAVSDGFVLLDRAFRFRHVNGVAERVLGRPRQELLGRELWAEQPGLADTSFGRAYRRAMSERIAVEVEGFYPPLGAWFAARAVPTTSGLVLLFRDLSSERRADGEGVRRRQLAELLADVVGALARAEQLAPALQLCAEAVVRHLDVAFARIWTASADAPVLELRASAGLYTHLDGPHSRVPIGRYKIGLIAAERKPHLTNDVSNDARVSDQDWARREGMVAFAGYPLIVESRLVGVVALFSRRPLSDDVLEALAAISDSIAVGIERKRTEEARERALAREQQRAFQLKALARAALELNAAPSLESLLQCLTDRARSIIGAHQSVTSMTRGEGWAQSINAVSLSDKYAGFRSYAAPTDGSGIYAYVCERNAPVRMTQAELEAHPRWRGFGQHAASHPPMRGWLAAPLVGRNGRNLGLVQLSDKTDGGEFTEEDEAVLVQLTQLASVAVENASLLAASERERRITKAITDNATVGLLLMDDRQRCTFMNPAAEGMTGLVFADVKTREVPLHDLIHHSHPDGRPFPMDECPIDRALPTRMQERGEDMFVRPDGSFYPVSFTASPILEGDRPVGTVIELRDVTMEKRKEAERAALLERLREEAETIAAELDRDKLVQAVTDAATQLSGAQFGAFFYNVTGDAGEKYLLYTLSGVPLEKFSRFPNPRNTAIFAPTFAGERIVRIDDVRVHPDFGKNAPHHGLPKGHLPVVSYLAVPVISRSGEVIGGLFFGHERPGVFTERAERLVAGLASQAAVAMDNARLFREAQQLIAALERSNRELDQFAYVTSHDLKAPLRGIASLSEWIEEDLADKLSPESRDQMELLRSRVKRLEALINGILDYSRAGRKTTTAEPVALGSLLKEVTELLGPGAEAVVEVAPDLPTIVAERVPLQQVFLNLIGNALKHAARNDPRVSVTARVVDAAWEFHVSDNGPGIEPQFHDRIWGLFQTLEARDKVEGTGIGLAVVRKIVESRGGRAWVESELGRGATFKFTWPKAESAKR
jgi:PAS domain S-box-containing protein